MHRWACVIARVRRDSEREWRSESQSHIRDRSRPDMTSLLFRKMCILFGITLNKADILYFETLVYLNGLSRKRRCARFYTQTIWTSGMFLEAKECCCIIYKTKSLQYALSLSVSEREHTYWNYVFLRRTNFIWKYMYMQDTLSR